MCVFKSWEEERFYCRTPGNSLYCKSDSVIAEYWSVSKTPLESEPTPLNNVDWHSYGSGMSVKGLLLA